MFDSKINKEHLIQRREEILRQLGRLETPIHEELDRNADEQAIQLEQTDVTLSMVDGLNRELRQIEEMLFDSTPTKGLSAGAVHGTVFLQAFLQQSCRDGQEVMCRQDAHEFAVLAHRQAADSPVPH